MCQKCILNVFLFSVGNESGEFDELDGAGEICGNVFGGEIEEHVPHVQHGVLETLGPW